MRFGGDRRLVPAERGEISVGRHPPRLRPLDLRGEVAGRPELVRRRQRVRDRRRISAFVGRIRPTVRAEAVELPERRGVEGARLDTADAERREPRPHLARRLVRERHRKDLVALNAPETTCLAIRRVIVVVFPEPAPARMQTGPRPPRRRAAAPD